MKKRQSEKYEFRMPDPLHRGSSHAMTIGELVRFAFEEDTLCGFVLPDFQRPPVWTREQNIRFIESIWQKIPIGSYSINVDGYGSPYNNLLIDGQQRLRAIQGYCRDMFPVFGLKYSELNLLENRVFNNTVFNRFETKYEDVDSLRGYYNKLNFGGTPHTEDQRA